MKLAALLGIDFQNAIVALSNEKLPMPTAYKLKKIIKKVNEELVNYNELLAKLQEQHKDEEGKVDQAAFMKDYQELVNMDIETDKLEMKNLQNVTLSTKDLVFLEPILDDSEA